MKWYCTMSLDHWNQLDKADWAIPIDNGEIVLVKPEDGVNPALKVIANNDVEITVIEENSSNRMPYAEVLSCYIYNENAVFATTPAGGKHHKCDCQYIVLEDKPITYESVQDAEASGLTNCTICKEV